MRIGYVPYNQSLSAPGDVRRFCAYARLRELNFEIANINDVYDIVILSEQADITQWVNYTSGKIVYDLIDSYLATSVFSSKNLLRGSYKYFSGSHLFWEFDYRKSVANLCKVAKAVVCTTEEQKATINRYCNNVHIILDIHSSVASKRKVDYARRGNAFKIVWEGLGVNIRQLYQIREALLNLSMDNNIELHIVTDPFIHRYLGKLGNISTQQIARDIFPNSFVHLWHPSTCAQLICDCDLAVIPIDSDPFNRGKPENKLLLLWKMGMPVVTTNTPAYQRAMCDAGLDLTCSDTATWIKTIQALIDNPGIRAMSGNKGYEYADQHFSEEQIASKWDNLFLTLGYSP